MILNLSNPKKGSIDFRVSNFPDGQRALSIETPAYTLKDIEAVTIKSRITSFRDLELIICANQALKELGVKSISLDVPYFLGARSDRKFGTQTNYLKNVICPIINSQGFSSVTVLDPHSYVLEACLNNFHYASMEIYHSVLFKELIGSTKSPLCVVAPDAGGIKRAYDFAKKFNLPMITASKVRDIATGDIVRTDIPDLNSYKKHEFVIIDDICDGGRTFVELAKAIHSVRKSAKLHLAVTHGIFSNGMTELIKHFNSVRTTNSYQESPHSLLVI